MNCAPEDGDLAAESPVPQPEVANNLCKNCQQREYQEGHLTLLCTECREKFVRFPIPRWIVIFGIAVLVAMVVTAYRIPACISAGVDLEHADEAMGAKKFLTAQRLLLSIRQDFPNHLETNGKLLIASVKNWDATTALEAYSKIKGIEIKDEAFLSKMQDAMTKLAMLMQPEGVPTEEIKAASDSANQLRAIFDSLDRTDVYTYSSAGYVIAARLYDLNEYDRAEVMLKEVLSADEANDLATYLMCAVKRQQGDLAGAAQLCNALLYDNAENVGVLAQFAKIEMKRHNDSKAAEYVHSALSIDETHTGALEVSAMLDFFRGDERSSRKKLARIRKIEDEENDRQIADRLEKMLDGTTKYR